MKRMRLLAVVLLCSGVTTCVLAAADQSTQPAFGLDRLPPLQQTFAGYPLWQYCASLLWILLAFLLTAIIDVVMTRVVKKLVARTKTRLDDDLAATLRKPLKIIVMVVMLNTGIEMFAWPGWFSKILSPIFIITLGSAAIYIAVQLVELLLHSVEERFFKGDVHLTRLMLPVLGKTMKVFVIIIGVLTIAQHLGLQIASVITGLGIGGIAVALAAQNTLANMFGSLVILGDHLFHTGDRIQIDKFDGVVETIGLRSTRLRTTEGNVVTIPNKTVADSAVVNYTTPSSFTGRPP